MEIESQVVDVTSTAVLMCVAGAEPMADFFWMKNGERMDASSSRVDVVTDHGQSTLYVHDFRKDDSGMYQCVAENAHGKVFSAASLVAHGWFSLVVVVVVGFFA